MKTQRDDQVSDPRSEQDEIAGRSDWHPFQAHIVPGQRDCGHSEFLIRILREHPEGEKIQIAEFHEDDAEKVIAMIRECQWRIQWIRTKELIKD